MKKKCIKGTALALLAAMSLSIGALPVTGALAPSNPETKSVIEEGASLSVTEKAKEQETKQEAVEKLPQLAPGSEEYIPTITASPLSETVNLLEGGIYETAANYEKFKSEEYYQPGVDCFAPVDVQMSWTAEEGALYYTVKLGMDKALTNATSYVTFESAMSIPDLFTGETYYYQIIVHYADKTVKSRIFEFKTANLPRTIYLEGVSNTRDAGGYYTEDGQYRVRQGMVYRGGKLEGMTAAAKEKALKVYGFKTDLDLRAETGASPLGSSVNFVNVSGPYYSGPDTGIISDKSSTRLPYWEGTYRDALKLEIQTFANRDNYPIYVHCSLGRDRTGTLIFLINALCGVGEKDLYMDYELSFFSQVGTMDNASPTRMVTTFHSLYEYIRKYSDGTVKENTELFMLDLGITQEEINTIRSILCEEVQK